jgi:hypothetical protein
MVTVLPRLKAGASAFASRAEICSPGTECRTFALAIPGRELTDMRNILGLPLADPSSDSLGRLNGQRPGLFYVACAHNVGVVRIPAGCADKLRLRPATCRIYHPTLGAALRRVWRIDELQAHRRVRGAYT